MFLAFRSSKYDSKIFEFCSKCPITAVTFLVTQKSWLLKGNKINGKDNTYCSMFLIKNEMSNVCAKMFLCQSSSCNTMIQVTLKTTAVCSSETAAPIHDTNCGTHTRHKLRHSYTTQTAAPIHDTKGRHNTGRMVFCFTELLHKYTCGAYGWGEGGV